MKNRGRIAKKLVQTAILLALVAIGVSELIDIASGQESTPPSVFMPQVVQESSSVRPTDDVDPTALPTESSTPAATPTESMPAPVAAWYFQEAAGGSAADASGNGYDGELNGPVWTTDGDDGSGLQFDGVDDSVRVSGLDMSGTELTISALIRANRLDHLSGHDARIISKSAGLGEQECHWMLATVGVDEETRLQFRLRVNGVTKILIADAQGVVVPGAWTHVSASFDGETMRLYKNGVQVGSCAHCGVNDVDATIDDDPSIEAWIGDHPPSQGSRPWHGIIDNVMLHDKALSQPQIETLIPEELVELPPVDATATATPVNTPVDATATPTPVETPPGGTVTPPDRFLETFDGDPNHPTPFRSAVWDVTVHSRSMSNLYELQGMEAQHAPNCDPPPATHVITAYEDAAFTCRNHMMTAINDSAYGLIYLTPAYQVDFTEGTATIRFDLSTQRTSLRDWVDLYISPMEDHLQLALIDWLPDLGGEPKRAIHVKMDTFDGRTNFNVNVIDDHVPHSVASLWWVGYEEYLEPSAMVRSTFELQLSRTHIKFGMPDYDLWWVDSDIAPLDWTAGVVQFGHHSYTPDKDCMMPGGCGPNTWHWDNISIEPARPFTMIHAAKRYVDATNGPEVSFESRAPENAFLRFAGIGQNLEVSFDGGGTWQAAQVQEQERYTEEAFWSYFTPIPAGTDSVRFRGEPFWGGPWHVRDLSIWAE